jgi:hypothetical protein
MTQTVILTQPVRVGGSVLAAGTTQTLARDIAADLVARGFATPVGTPVWQSLTQQNVTAQTDQVTGAKVITLAEGKAPLGVFPAMAAFKNALTSGITAGIQVLSDSTANDTYEWPYTFAEQLATEYPSYTVKHMLWSDSSQDYLQPTVIQTGTDGALYMDLVSGNYPRKLPVGSVPHLTGSIDIRIDLTCADWAPANSFGATVLVGEGGGTGAWGWSLALHTSGGIALYYSVDGTALLSINTFTGNGITDGSRAWIRATLTPDDGSGNYVYKTYKSTNGITWTQIGSTITTAGAIVLKDQVAQGLAYQLGSQGAATNVTSIRIHEVQIRDGIDGPSIAARYPDGWGSYGAGTTCPVVGSPELTVVNGSKVGADITYLDNATRLKKLTPDYGQMLTILSCSHNHVQMTGRAWYSAYSAWVANVKARLGTGITALTQNPQTSAALGNASQSRRRLDLVGFSKALGIDFIDTYAAFLSHSGWENDYMSDTVHPNAAGAQVIMDEIKSAFDMA